MQWRVDTQELLDEGGQERRLQRLVSERGETTVAVAVAIDLFLVELLPAE